MPDLSITGHMVVKNEDRFVWYAINSVLPYVDKLLITDTGSTDQTVKIIESLRSNKIIFSSCPIHHARELAQVRQKQVNDTESDWIWIIDGDEVYPKSLSEEIIKIIRNEGSKLEGIVVRRFDLIGDIYHYQTESVGTYQLFGERGHFAIRLLNKKNIPGIHVKGIYPYEGYYDKDNIEVIHRSKNKYRFTVGKMYHAMYLKRSTKGAIISDTFHRNKWKIELGNKIKTNTSVPEVFFLPHPEYVPDSFQSRSKFYDLIAYIITPIKILKRRLWKLL